ncbi:unnamed protein product [Trichobilharzia regenti]|nr:unnamed protein product [Trichobilharzia regenti]
MNFDSNGIRITQDQLKAIDEYEEYRRYLFILKIRFSCITRIVGEDDVFYFELPNSFIYFTVIVFSLIQHKTDFEVVPTERPVPLPCKHCNCASFHVMPKFGSQIARCHCKHYATDHSVVSCEYYTILLGYYFFFWFCLIHVV